MLPLNVDTHGALRGVEYHDGHLEGVLVRDATVYLGLRSTSGERRALILQDVMDLCLDGFRQGNIILGIRVLSLPQAMRDDAVRAIVSEKLFRTLESLEEDVRVFLLESSYGAEIVALCKGVETSDAGVTLGLQVNARAQRA